MCILGYCNDCVLRYFLFCGGWECGTAEIVTAARYIWKWANTPNVTLYHQILKIHRTQQTCIRARLTRFQTEDTFDFVIDVISCRKVAENTQIFKIAKFAR